MALHASKARFARWESIVYTARLMYCYQHAPLLRGLMVCENPDCDSEWHDCSYGGTD